MRQREIAVRLSLGASRGRLVKQLLVESLVLSFVGGAVGVAVAVGLTEVLLAFVPTEGRPLLIHATPDLRILALHLPADALHRRRLRPHPGAARQPPGSLDDAEGHDGIDRGRGRIAVPAQGPGGRAGGAQLPAALRSRTVRAQPAEPQGTNTGVELDNLVTFQLSPAYSGYSVERAGDLQPAARGSPARVGRRQVGRLFRRVHSQRRRVGQLDVGRGAQGGRRRRHAGVHERRVAGLLRGHEDSAPRGARLHAHGRDAAGRRPSVACVHRQQEVRRPLLQGQERCRAPRGTGRRSGHEARHRDHRRCRRCVVRGTARRCAPAGVRAQSRQHQRHLLHPRQDGVVGDLLADPERGARAGLRHARLRDEVRGDAAGRDAAVRSPRRAAVRRVRSGGHRARLDWPLRRDGVRRRAAPQGAGHPPGARRAAAPTSSGW